MTDEIRLEDVIETLSRWSLQAARQRDYVHTLENRVDELSLINKHGITQVQEVFGLPAQTNMTLQMAVDQAVLAVRHEAAEDFRQIEKLKAEIDLLKGRIAGFEGEIREAITRLVDDLELPQHPHRTLLNAVTEVAVLITQAKKIVQENL